MTWLAFGLLAVWLVLGIAYVMRRRRQPCLWDGPGPCPVCAERADEQARQRIERLGDCPEHRSWRGER